MSRACLPAYEIRELPLAFGIIPYFRSHLTPPPICSELMAKESWSALGFKPEEGLTNQETPKQ